MKTYGWCSNVEMPPLYYFEDGAIAKWFSISRAPKSEIIKTEHIQDLFWYFYRTEVTGGTFQVQAELLRAEQIAFVTDLWHTISSGDAFDTFDSHAEKATLHTLWLLIKILLFFLCIHDLYPVLLLPIRYDQQA
jgi:hypothetical protein